MFWRLYNIMKIDLKKINTTKFTIKERDGLFLVNPERTFFDWTKEELIFRSSIWNSDGELVSAGFKKFFNYDESVDISERPDSIENCNFLEKLDGSLIIMSKYRGKMIYRTRGTFSVFPYAGISHIENYEEISDLIKKYNLDSILKQHTSDASLLFECTTPSNRIVLAYDKPDLTLIGMIDHMDYSYISQEGLDECATRLKLNRPRRYTFESLKDLIMLKNRIDIEGVCMYYNQDQSIVKIKTTDYLKRHSFRYSISYKKLANIYVDFLDKNKFFDKQEFKYELTQLFDFESALFALATYGDELFDKVAELDTIIAKIQKDLVNKNWSSQIDKKYVAEYINKTYNGFEKTLAFNLYNSKNINYLIRKFLLHDI